MKGGGGGRAGSSSDSGRGGGAACLLLLPGGRRVCLNSCAHCARIKSDGRKMFVKRLRQ